MKSLSKPKKIKNDKYIPANKENKYLLITEGESACGSLMSTMGLEQCGYYMLKGKPLNTWDVSQQKFTSNKELADLYNIIKNTTHESPEEEGEWYEIEIDGKMQIVNENDEIFYRGSWKLVKDLL
jgi:DNA gyrase/topoisomerase IV subunit B